MAPQRSHADRRPELLEIETDRVVGRTQAHVGVVDIGSNSIRLVVYDDLSRAPFPRFNEKSFVALGAGIGDDGRLTESAMRDARHAIRRFAAIARAMGVERIDVVATEAMRRATNRSELIDAIHHDTGWTTRLLTGDEEARFAALGVVAGFFEPTGLVGDIGGGSLEIAEVVTDRVGDRVASMPLGALPVAEVLANDGVDAAKRHVDDVLAEQLPPLLTDPTLYAVGGGWRALARVHLAANERPIGVVHGYAIDAGQARRLAKGIARMTPDEVAALPDVPSRRVGTLPAAALVLSRLVKRLEPERVVFSSNGLREGWLYAQLDDEERRRDPLLEGAMAIGVPTARVPRFSEALAQWTDGLFPGESASDRRLRLATCALTDIAWRDHAKVRAEETFERLLHFPLTGLGHADRAFLAVAVMSRYGGKVDARVVETVGDLLSAHELRRAEILGRVLLLGHRFSACVPEFLHHARLRIETDAVRLEVAGAAGEPDSDAVSTRLRQLAKATGVDAAEIVLVE